MRFTNKNILVTGGNSGIGLATAAAFAKEGANVAITGRDQTTLDTAAASIGNGTLAITSDAGSLDDIDTLVDQLTSRWDRVDSVFVNAGIAAFGPFADMTTESFDSSFDINVKGPYFLMQKITPLMPPGSTIVLNGSVNARIGMAGSSVYAASKAALISMAKTLSTELLEAGIRVNVVSPGPVSTPLYGRLGLGDEALQTMATGIQSQIPLGRFAEADEVAAAVLHLASAESSFIVGTELIVDGGMTQL